jgi:hypothetical protein
MDPDDLPPLSSYRQQGAIDAYREAQAMNNSIELQYSRGSFCSWLFCSLDTRRSRFGEGWIVISKKTLSARVDTLVERVKILEGKKTTLTVPVVDEDGKRVVEDVWTPDLCGFRKIAKSKALSFTEVCRALQDMCGIEITYQEIEGKSGVVIYEKEVDCD